MEAGSFYEFDSGNMSQVPGYGSTYLSFKDLQKNYEPTDWDLITANQLVSFVCCWGNLLCKKGKERAYTEFISRGLMAAKFTIRLERPWVEGKNLLL